MGYYQCRICMIPFASENMVKIFGITQHPPSEEMKASRRFCKRKAIIQTRFTQTATNSKEEDDLFKSLLHLEIKQLCLLRYLEMFIYFHKIAVEIYDYQVVLFSFNSIMFFRHMFTSFSFIITGRNNHKYLFRNYSFVNIF